jgi:D-alanine-D-alanine ligase-like ATP-grasp enzyme
MDAPAIETAVAPSAHEGPPRFWQGLLTIAAFERGVAATRLPDDLLKLERAGETVFMRGGWCSRSDRGLSHLTADKRATKAMLAAGGAPVPRGDVFGPDELETALRYAEFLRFPVVVKPNLGKKGELVFPHVRSEEQFAQSFRTVARSFDTVMVEKWAPGFGYRFFTTKGKIVAVIRCEPASVIGHGGHTVRELIVRKNREKKRRYQMSAPIKIDRAVHDHLARQSLTLESVPKERRRIWLRINSNLSTGGDAVDVTDSIHSGYRAALEKAGAAFDGILNIGFDAIIQDDTAPPDGSNWVMLEANSAPMFCCHHFPYEGKARNVAGAIVAALYPDAEPRRS